MAFLFKKIAKGERVDTSKLDKLEIRDWLRKKAMEAKKASFKNTHEENTDPFKRLQNLSENSIGKMYTFMYDPKTKEELPYYDIFPLIFPIEYYSDSMLG